MTEAYFYPATSRLISVACHQPTKGFYIARGEFKKKTCTITSLTHTLYTSTDNPKTADILRHAIGSDAHGIKVLLRVNPQYRWSMLSNRQLTTILCHIASMHQLLYSTEMRVFSNKIA